MLFNSLNFAVFFPLVCVIFFSLPSKQKLPFLLLASCVFYSVYIPAYLLILLLVVAIDFIAGIAIENAPEKKKSLYLTISILMNVGLLAVFKYYNFALTNIQALAAIFNCRYFELLPFLNLALPIGLSFHTFQSMSYTIEVRAGRQRAERNLLVYTLYVLFFPQLVAGPIERPQNLLHQFREIKAFDENRVVRGLQLMLWGFIKKVVIADRLAPLVDSAYAHYSEHTGAVLVLISFFFAIQLYCDFSGYSDIAIGSAEVLGFKLMENFRRPYLACSLPNFWQRWHISLTSWFRDYLFLPISFWCQQLYLATVVVFMISGLWHGANWTFVVWGGLHGTAMSIIFFMRKHFPKLKFSDGIGGSFCGFLATFSFVSLTHIYFRAQSLEIANAVAMSCLSFCADLLLFRAKLNELDANWYSINSTELFWALSLTLLFSAAEYIQDKWSLRQFPEKFNAKLRYGLYYLALSVILFLGKFDARPFIYFQF
ncbi:MAG: hypothetical protein K2X27_25690 [Candidatus Obscuribacterales bacterium]|nr:hypothetical protein [Candidatus Obscuribacterales bacterium]